MTKKKFLRTFRKAAQVLAIVLICALLLPGGALWAAGGNPPALSTVAVPEPPNLADFVKNKDAAIKLGKALFWDMQAGSDGVTACATCHYGAGADPLTVRAQNQINPGPDGAFDVVTGANQTLDFSHALPTGDFPFFSITPANNKNDIAGSQGVSLHLFDSLNGAVDNGTQEQSPLFGSYRQVTGRNTPPAVNAIFNYANFWDGRASNTFNGNDPIGPLDVDSGIWIIGGVPENPILVKQKIAIANASLAAQATGPPLSPVEMSWAGRTWPLLGRKMLDPTLIPLGTQHVDALDSVLGAPLAKVGTGLNTTYSQMVKDAFWPAYWSSVARTPDGFTQMEANFSLFWGLAIQLYEATLVSDQTPFDKYLVSNNPLDLASASDPAGTLAEAGFGVFKGKGGCINCHSGSELTDASYTEAFASGLIEKGNINANSNAISDVGFHNIGVRPTAEDGGRGGVINFDLSFAMQAIDQVKGTLPFAAPWTLEGITANTPVAVNGTFKTPSIRNVELTPPYMHNGSIATLEDVVEFYSRGGNYPNAELSKDMTGGIIGVAADKANLVLFLKALTDPRVKNETAPFDHPELQIPISGDPANPDMYTLFATGAGGTSATAHAAMTMTLADLPKATLSGAPASITNQTAVSISVGGTNVATYMYKLDTGVYSTATPSTTPISRTGLADGPHTISVIGVDAAGHQQMAASPTTASFTVSTAQPALDIHPVETMTKNSTQTISGTVEAGAIPVVSVNTGASVGPVTVIGTTWTCTVSGLAKGDNNITVTVTNAAGTTASKIASVKILIADGCFRGTGSPDITDALKALRMSVGLVTATVDDMMHGDVNADSKIDSGDALLILRKATGLTSF
jgi:cytochrome c peroxidase